MKPSAQFKLSFISLLASALAGTTLFADYEYYVKESLDYRVFSGGSFRCSRWMEASCYGAKFIRANLSDATFESATLTNADFTNADLTDARLNRATLTGADFTGATLTEVVAFEVSAQNVNFTGANLTEAVFSYSFSTSSNLSGAKFVRANLTKADLSYATLMGADFTDAVIMGADFGHTGLTLSQLRFTKSYTDRNLSGVGLEGLGLSGGDFSGFDFTGASLKKATLTGVDFTGAKLESGCIHFVSARNANFTGADLTGADLSGYSYSDDAKFNGAKFIRADLTGANLSYTTLTEADFTGAVITGVNFFASNLTLSQLCSTQSYKDKNLSGVTFRRVYLNNGDFSGFNLNGADFTNAVIAGADFRGATGLDLTWDSETKKFSNTSIKGTSVILADGTIGNFSVADGEKFLIRAHAISAKLNDDGTIAEGGEMELAGSVFELGGVLTNNGKISITAQIDGANSQIVIKDGAMLTNAGTILIQAGTLAAGNSVNIFADENGSAVAFNQGTIKAFGGIYANGVFTVGAVNSVIGELASAQEITAGTSLKISADTSSVTLSAAAEAVIVNAAKELDAASVVIDTGTSGDETLAAWSFDIENGEGEAKSDVLVVLNVGQYRDASTIKIFHKADGENAEWEDYTDIVGNLSYDEIAGTVSFITSDFSSYAVTGIAIPEPSMFGLLAGLGALAFVGIRRRRK